MAIIVTQLKIVCKGGKKIFLNLEFFLVKFFSLNFNLSTYISRLYIRDNFAKMIFASMEFLFKNSICLKISIW